MPLYRFNSKIILFIHVPKCGGASCENMLQEAGGLQSMKAIRAHPPLPCSPQHFHGDLLRKLFRPGFYDYAFLVVRNPYDRLASEYKMRKKLDPDLPEFNAWTDEVFTGFAKDNFINDNHIRPQKQFHFDGVEIFRFEDGLLRVMETVLGACDISCQSMEEAHKNMSEKEIFWARPSTIERIREFYAEDFQFFSYSTDVEGTALKLL